MVILRRLLELGLVGVLLSPFALRAEESMLLTDSEIRPVLETVSSEEVLVLEPIGSIIKVQVAVVPSLVELSVLGGVGSVKPLFGLSGIHEDLGRDSRPVALNRVASDSYGKNVSSLKLQRKIQDVLGKDMKPESLSGLAGTKLPLPVTAQSPVVAVEAPWSLVPYRIWVDSPAGRRRQQAEQALRKGDETLAETLREEYWQVIERTAARRDLHKAKPVKLLRREVSERE